MAQQFQNNKQNKKTTINTYSSSSDSISKPNLEQIKEEHEIFKKKMIEDKMKGELKLKQEAKERKKTIKKSPLPKSPSRKSPSRKSPSRKSPSRKSPSRNESPKRKLNSLLGPGWGESSPERKVNPLGPGWGDRGGKRRKSRRRKSKKFR